MVLAWYLRKYLVLALAPPFPRLYSHTYPLGIIPGSSGRKTCHSTPPPTEPFGIDRCLSRVNRSSISRDMHGELFQSASIRIFRTEGPTLISGRISLFRDVRQTTYLKLHILQPNLQTGGTSDRGNDSAQHCRTRIQRRLVDFSSVGCRSPESRPPVSRRSALC